MSPTVGLCQYLKKSCTPLLNVLPFKRNQESLENLISPLAHIFHPLKKKWRQILNAAIARTSSGSDELREDCLLAGGSRFVVQAEGSFGKVAGELVADADVVVGFQLVDVQDGPRGVEDQEGAGDPGQDHEQAPLLSRRGVQTEK